MDISEAKAERRGEIIRRIDGANIGELASAMIRIPGHARLPGRETKMAEFVYRFFEKRGIEVIMNEACPGRPNVVARLRGKGGGRSLMLCGHLDTVPPYDMAAPFDATINGGRLRGRGACDMKGPLAAMMTAFAAVSESGAELGGDLLFAGLVDEEESNLGVVKLVEEGLVADSTIVGEPTGMDIALGHKGLEWIRVDFYGKKVHGGHPEEGLNAISMAAHFIEIIENEYAPSLKQRRDKDLGCPTVNIGKIAGGDQPSTVPDFCEVLLDRRYVPSESRKQVYAELEGILEGLRRGNPGLRALAGPIFERAGRWDQPPFMTRPDCGLVKSVQTAAGVLGMGGAGLTTFPAWTDGGTISNFSDSEVIIMGPGNLSLAHTADESIGLNDLYKAAAIYGLTALGYCG